MLLGARVGKCKCAAKVGCERAARHLRKIAEDAIASHGVCVLCLRIVFDIADKLRLPAGSDHQSLVGMGVGVMAAPVLISSQRRCSATNILSACCLGNC